jgi:membrane-associated phospholipid phosphatase
VTSLLPRRSDPDERAGLRLGLLGIGFLALAVLFLPLAVLVRDQWSPLAHLDTRVAASAHRLVVAHEWLATAAKLLTHLGAPVLLEAVAAVLVVVLLVHRRRRSALFLAVSVIGAYTLSTTGKLVVDRARPAFPDPISHANGAAFPSGHATGSAAFYLALAVLLLPLVGRSRRPWLWVMATVVPVIVAATRVLLGVHYPTDVVAGLLIGWGWVAACTALFAAWRAEEGRPAPVLEEGVDPES